MAKTVVFLSQTPLSPALADQRAQCAREGDEVIVASAVRFTHLLIGSSRHGATLKAGDRLRLYDLNSLPYPQASLVRMLVKLLRAGVFVEVFKERLNISPDPADPLFQLLTVLDKQQRAMHALRTRGAEPRAGRKPALSDNLWPEIEALLGENVALQEIGARYGVARTTLFNYVRRMKSEEALQKERVQADPEEIG